jgi:hypothetical protein
MLNRIIRIIRKNRIRKSCVSGASIKSCSVNTDNGQGKKEESDSKF